jgi:superfamily II DNA or RNA helicase
VFEAGDRIFRKQLPTMKTLFTHQELMVQAANSDTKGIIQSPTGSGKTLAQSQIALDEISKGGFRVIAVKTPRISLTNQLAKEYTEYLNDRGVSPITFMVHSGESADFSIDETLTDEEKLEAWDSLPESIEALIHTEEIKSKVKRAKQLDVPVLVFTTYHSNPKLISALKKLKVEIDLDINDEGHYLTGEEFGKILGLTSPKRQYFFTATLKTTESSAGKGMNNRERFGQILYNMSVAEAVKLGIVLPLKARLIKSGTVVSDQDVIDNEIGEFVEATYRVLELEFPELGAKMIVSSKGARQIQAFLGSPEFPDLIGRGVNILTVHSNKGLTTHNGREITRKEFNEMKDVLGKDLSAKMIIVHYDILSEGIDIQGLQGALILRKMTRSKFYQNVGRIIRVLRGNEGIKPHGLLMFPDVTDADMKKAFCDFFMELRADNYLPREFFSEFNPSGESEEEDQFDGRESEGETLLSYDLNLMLFEEDIDRELSLMTEEEKLAFYKSLL